MNTSLLSQYVSDPEPYQVFSLTAGKLYVSNAASGGEPLRDLGRYRVSVRVDHATIFQFFFQVGGYGPPVYLQRFRSRYYLPEVGPLRGLGPKPVVHFLWRAAMPLTPAGWLGSFCEDLSRREKQCSLYHRPQPALFVRKGTTCFDLTSKTHLL